MASIPSSEQLLSVGRIQTAYGIKGWVWVYSNTDPMDNIFAYAPWYLQRGNEWSEAHIAEWRVQGKGIVMRLQDCNDRNTAESWHGAVIWTAKANLPSLADGDYYWSDLIDMSVWTVDGRLLGQVHSMMETGANDVLVVNPVAGSIDQRERLIPWLPEQVITTVDVTNKRLTVDWDVDF